MSDRSGGRRWWAAGLLAALLIAGVGSFYASTRPDGLGYVSSTLGFDDRAQGSRADRSPLSGYRTTGVEDPRLSRGLAGVLGTVTVLALGGGLFWVLRSRSKDRD